MFSDASLQNSYAFFLNGTRRSTGGVFLRAGSFIADGQGHITGGIEDLNEQGDITQDLLFDGIYSVGPDGRGWVQFCELVNSLCTTPPSTFRIVMASAQRVQITEFDQFITATGEMELQDPSAFTSAGLSGNYTFDFFGLLSSLTAKSVVGELSANGNGSILSGEIDINNDGTLTNLPILKTSTHSISANGRGTARLVTSTQTLTFSFYIVSSGSTKFIGPDPTSILGGEAYAQQLSTLGKWGLNALKGDFIFQTAGSSAAGEITDAGRFTADGNGNIEPGSGILDEHHSGYVTLAAPFGGTYTLDATERGTLTFLSEITYTFYMVSSSKAVIQETGSSIVADGLLLAQTGGAITASSLNGIYALNITGQRSGFEEDFVGRPTTDGASNVKSGLLDINDAGLLVLGEQNSGSYSLITPNGRATMVLNPTTDNQHFVLYFVSPSQALVMGTDATRLAIGSFYKQFQ